MAIDEAQLSTRLGQVESLRAWPPGLVGRLREHILTAPDDACQRMNPIAFAKDAGVAENEAIELFLLATHAGALTMEWSLLCPLCGTAADSFVSLKRVHRHFTCAMCQYDAEASLDEQIQVGFTVASIVRRLPLHDPAAMAAGPAVRRRLTREAYLGDVRVTDLIRDVQLFQDWVEPGAEVRFRVELGAGMLGFAEFENHTGVHLPILDSPGGTLEIEVTDDEMTASRDTVGPGPLDVVVRSRRRERFAIMANNYPPGGRPELKLEPYLTGARLLTNQTFRRLFRGETVQSKEGLAVKDVTLLFTDLKGSTALYERIGDLSAFAIVQAHFDHLGAVIEAHGGAIVKTIGDAVMAAFTEPARAVRAAREMVTRIERFNEERGRRDVILKIGLHRGPSIAVTLNENLDYFGTTVNVAARVQGLADADEIYLTDDVYVSKDVKEIAGPVDTSDAQLRGIQRPVRVHRLRG